MTTVPEQAAARANGGPRNRGERRHSLLPEAGSLTPLAYTPSDAGRMLGLSRSKTYELISSGDIRARKLAGRIVVEHAELVRFIESLPVRETV